MQTLKRMVSCRTRTLSCMHLLNPLLSATRRATAATAHTCQPGDFPRPFQYPHPCPWTYTLVKKTLIYCPLLDTLKAKAIRTILNFCATLPLRLEGRGTVFWQMQTKKCWVRWTKCSAHLTADLLRAAATAGFRSTWTLRCRCHNWVSWLVEGRSVLADRGHHVPLRDEEVSLPCRLPQL